MTASSAAYRQNFGPFASDVYHAPFPDAYRGWTTDRAIDGLERLFATEASPDRVAAIIIEPELGEGGFVPAPADFLRRLREIATRHGIVLVADEVQSGFGRTGKMFGYQHAGIEPDLVVLAKSLGGGAPLSAVVGHAAMMDAPLPGGLGGTYGGNPLSCAAALAVLDVFDRELIVDRAERLGHQLQAGLLKLQSRASRIARANNRTPTALVASSTRRAREGCCYSNAVRTRTSCACCRRSWRRKPTSREGWKSSAPPSTPPDVVLHTLRVVHPLSFDCLPA